MSISVKIILDTRRIKQKTSKYPVKLRVTFKRVSRNYTTVYELSDKDFDKLTASRISTELQQKKLINNKQRSLYGIR